MGRALKPTRRVAPRNVKVGDVVLVRSSRTGNLRWMLVDSMNDVPNLGAPYIWSGRWAFGGQWTIFTAHHDSDRYTVKDRTDAERDAQRLAALPRNAHV